MSNRSPKSQNVCLDTGTWLWLQRVSKRAQPRPVCRRGLPWWHKMWLFYLGKTLSRSSPLYSPHAHVQFTACGNWNPNPHSSPLFLAVAATGCCWCDSNLISKVIIDGSNNASGTSRRNGRIELPLVLRSDHKCQTVKALKAKTKENHDRYFYIRPSSNVSTLGAQLIHCHPRVS